VAVVAANAALAVAAVVVVSPAAVTQAKNRVAAASVAEKTLRA
jgi:hypothetical protein